MISLAELQRRMDAASIEHFDAREFTSRPIPDRFADNAIRILRVADMLREWMGEPLLLTSGYRDVATNAAVGGSSGSSHISAAAVDLRVVKAHLRADANLRLRRGAALIWIGYPDLVAGVGLYAQNIHLDVTTQSKARRWWTTTKKPKPGTAIERARWFAAFIESVTPEQARAELLHHPEN